MSVGFTLIELIFVILIFSIITFTSVNQITLIYDDFSQKNTISKLKDETEYAAQKLELLFENSIKESIISFSSVNYEDCKSIHDTLISNDSKTIAWLGIEKYGQYGEYQNGYYTPYWSGIVNLEKSNTLSINDPVANFDKQLILEKDISGSANIGAIYFDSTSTKSCEDFYINGGKEIFEVTGVGNILTFTNNKPTQISQKYYLTNSAYAIKIENESDLVLYYNFHPWQQQTYLSGSKTIISRNIASFGVESSNGLIRLNICSKHFEGMEQKICVEKAIF